MNKLSKKISVVVPSLLLVIGLAAPVNAQQSTASVDSIPRSSTEQYGTSLRKLKEHIHNSKTEGRRTSRNAFILDKNTGELSEYDEDGNVTITLLDKPALDELLRNKVPNSRSFDGTYRVDVPEEDEPEDGVDVGNPFMVDPDNYINLETFNFPSDMEYIDVYFTNDLEDDTAECLDVEENDMVWLSTDYPNENYVARVSCYYDSYDNVKLRTFTD